MAARSENTPEQAILADRLNSEPVIFKGCTSSELGMMLFCAVVFWVPMSIMVAAAFGRIAMALGLSGLGILATVTLGATFFQRIKRGRPDNYYQHLLMLKLHDLSLRHSTLIRRGGFWSLGRNFLERS